jgi:hypothetical protein
VQKILWGKGKKNVADLAELWAIGKFMPDIDLI